VRRVGAAVILSSLAFAGFLAASVLAGSRPLSALTDTTTTETTETTSTTASTATTPTPPPVPPKPRPKPRPKPTLPARLARRVQIGGIHVGGLTPAAALAAVKLAARSPLVVTVEDVRLSVSPQKLGVKEYVEEAVARARRAKPGASIPLHVIVRGADVRAWVAKLAANRDREVRDARVVLSGAHPRVMPERDGYVLRREATVAAIVDALLANRRGPVQVVANRERPSVRSAFFTSAIVIRRGTNKLIYYRDKGDGLEPMRTFTVATGQSSYPTPLGSFEIVQMWRDPWWYPPPSPWANGLKPIPPGPGNPLGTRWMGLSVPAVGIHGTPDAASLGYSASHGCIRMAIPSAEWLFGNVKVGTPVFIISA
jgi:lipoprotein-anchoring transpeptidase ErfK/SrfK